MERNNETWQDRRRRIDSLKEEGRTKTFLNYERKHRNEILDENLGGT